MSNIKKIQQSVTVLGATGSIGQSTLNIISNNQDKYSVFALTGFSNIKELGRLCIQHRPIYAVVHDKKSYFLLKEILISAGMKTSILYGTQALYDVASDTAVDIVIAAIVGSAGLKPTLAAINSGNKRILLANKEALIMAGALFMKAVRDSRTLLLPIDSEHNAIFQCLTSSDTKLINRIILTASGGPFLKTPIEQLEFVTPAQACMHPNWKMGKKISIDSASMMNKGLELIEAFWLFNLKSKQIDILIHPQSIIHSMVEYIDGSVIAQLSIPDMRIPISYAMSWPERITSSANKLNLLKIGKLEFQDTDEKKFPCLRLARQAIETGGSAPVILNAANEVAVTAFIKSLIKFTDIPIIIENVLNDDKINKNFNVETLDQILLIDKLARSFTEKCINI